MLQRAQPAWGKTRPTQVRGPEEQRDAPLTVKHEVSPGVRTHHRGERAKIPIPRVLRSLGQLHVWLRGNCVLESGKTQREASFGDLVAPREDQSRVQSKDYSQQTTYGAQGQSEETHLRQKVWRSRDAPTVVPIDGTRRAWEGKRPHGRYDWKTRGTSTTEIATSSIRTT